MKQSSSTTDTQTDSVAAFMICLSLEVAAEQLGVSVHDIEELESHPWITLIRANGRVYVTEQQEGRARLGLRLRRELKLNDAEISGILAQQVASALTMRTT